MAEASPAGEASLHAWARGPDPQAEEAVLEGHWSVQPHL